MQINTDKYFLHTSVFLRHASGASGEGEQQIETILAKAVVAKSRVWISSILFAELRPSVFIPGRFATLFELTRYFRSLATFVTPDPNIMLRAARLRDVKWQRSHAVGLADEKPMSLGDSIQIASALWVKEAIGVPDLGSSCLTSGESKRPGTVALSQWCVSRTLQIRRRPIRMRSRSRSSSASNLDPRLKKPNVQSRRRSAWRQIHWTCPLAWA
jgi:hypothetical protein